MSTVTEMGAVLGVAVVCAAVSIARASYYRHLKPKPPRPRKASPRRLGDDEREVVLAVLHEPRFADLAPAEVYATLLDEGRYLCSERTMYRVLAENSEVRERRKPALELGHHQAARPGQVDLLLPLRHPRRVQPLRGRLDGRAPRDGGARRAAHRGDLPAPADRPRPAHPPRRPRDLDDLEAGGAAPQRPGRDQEPLPAARLQRQPLLGGAVQDPQVPAGLPRALRLARGLARRLRRLLRLVQPRTPPLGARPAHPARRTPRPRPGAHRGARSHPR